MSTLSVSWTKAFHRTFAPSTKTDFIMILVRKMDDSAHRWHSIRFCKNDFIIDFHFYKNVFYICHQR